jgi:hypothetical protein
VEKFGSKVTVGEAAAAGRAGEILMIGGALGASWYIGGVVGSAAVATGRYAGCGMRLIDAISYARRNFPNAPWIERHLQAHPETFTRGHPLRRSYGQRARSAVA